jgi:hypothetical protein
VPSQIFFFGLTGGAERWLKIPLDLSQPEVTYAEQAFSVVRRTPVVEYFGPTTGFVVNYSSDRSMMRVLRPILAIRPNCYRRSSVGIKALAAAVMLIAVSLRHGASAYPGRVLSFTLIPSHLGTVG